VGLFQFPARGTPLIHPLDTLPNVRGSAFRLPPTGALRFRKATALPVMNGPLQPRRFRRDCAKLVRFVIVEPDAPWIECLILTISANGLCLDVGALVVPKIFAVAFTPRGSVRPRLRENLAPWRAGPRSICNRRGVTFQSKSKSVVGSLAS
jgi:hypothetical protein